MDLEKPRELYPFDVSSYYVIGRLTFSLIIDANLQASFKNNDDDRAAGAFQAARDHCRRNFKQAHSL